ncbi:glyoxal oxidase [Flammula alnicola]|nr:glyoxal oxidase [Flammula alnicola]
MLPPRSLLALCLATASSPVLAATAGSFADGGNTLISAMMMFLGNDQKVYMLDKAEGNAAQINGHPAWGAVWDIGTHQATAMDVRTNVFCASGMHLPNGSYVTFGGNGATGPGGNIGSQPNPGGFSGAWDSQYQDFDGTRAMRILNPCKNGDDFTSSQCTWFDEPTLLSMQHSRWYSAAEATAEGNVVIIGGFVNGGYVNRNYPNIDPVTEGNAADSTYEYYPPRAAAPATFNFLIQTSGLNAYAHTFLMPSGKMFVQANVSTILWDHEANVETPLPDMPGGVVRVYPASGATAMLPLTPANNYTPTMIFCGGSDMPEYAFGNYSFPYIDTWNYPASKDCQRITPEPQDGSAPVYVQDDDMMDGRTMGQFVILPEARCLFRWSKAGFSSSNIPRLYHSSAILLPDASVLIAGSNPNIDVNTSTVFPTTYKAEIFYPAYFSASTRPVPTGMPTTLSYGGNPFDLTIPASSYSGSANDAADNATVVLMRGGFTTHAMNMGQRHLQLNSTYTVNSNGSITLHVAQPPPNANLFQPGPALMFVNIHGIPSNGTYLIVGNGQLGTQPTAPASVLPPSIRLASASGSASGATTSGGVNATTTPKSTSHLGVIIGVVVGGTLLAGMRNTSFNPISSTAAGGAGGILGGPRAMRTSDSSAFVPLQQSNYSHAWNGSTTSLHAPYSDNNNVHAQEGANYGPDPYASSHAPRY